MHAGQLDLDDALVRRLVAGQFPQWAGLPLRRIASSGTVNAMPCSICGSAAWGWATSW
jgi:hypothetical protein